MQQMFTDVIFYNTYTHYSNIVIGRNLVELIPANRIKWQA